MNSSLDNNLEQILFERAAEKCATQEDRVNFCRKYLNRHEVIGPSLNDDTQLFTKMMHFGPGQLATAIHVGSPYLMDMKKDTAWDLMIGLMENNYIGFTATVNPTTGGDTLTASILARPVPKNKWSDLI